MNRKLAVFSSIVLLIAIASLLLDSGLVRFFLVILLILPAWLIFRKNEPDNFEEDDQDETSLAETRTLLSMEAVAEASRSASDNVEIERVKNMYRRKVLDLRALVRNLQQANSTANSLAVMAETQKTSVGSIISDSNLIQINANQAYAIADNIAGSANQAFGLSEHVQEKVASLADEMAASLKETEFLIEESQKISGILEMMNQIASSTHVLSINASIVAARAGVHGRAFDVVSKEIRALAQNTSASLANIESIISEIQGRIAGVAERTRQSSLGILGEKDALLSVAGALQGVILAVEVIRTVSSISSEKAGKLQNDASGISSSLDLLASNVTKTDTLAMTNAIYSTLDELDKLL